MAHKTHDDIAAHYVAFRHEVVPTGDGRWRYIVHSADHWVYRDGSEAEGPWVIYETGPPFATPEQADDAGHATVNYYHHLNPAETAEEGAAE